MIRRAQCTRIRWILVQLSLFDLISLKLGCGISSLWSNYFSIDFHIISYRYIDHSIPGWSQLNFFLEIGPDWMKSKWNWIESSSSGEWKDAGLELPHSVTTWQGRAVCVSEAYGFGMATGAAVEAFQPFFLELHIPYAAKRTEKLEVLHLFCLYTTQF